MRQAMRAQPRPTSLFTQLLGSEQYTGMRSYLSGHFVEKEHTELSSCVKVEVAVLGFSS